VLSHMHALFGKEVQSIFGGKWLLIVVIKQPVARSGYDDGHREAHHAGPAFRPTKKLRESIDLVIMATRRKGEYLPCCG
jgi:hypothetical protein